MQTENEQQRLTALHQYEVLDSPPEEQFDRVTAMAARIFETEFACVSLVDKSRFFFKSTYGVDIREVAREPGFCQSTIQQNDVHCIERADKDPLASTHSMVCNAPYIRFYAGAPITTHDGISIGTLCVLDTEPRRFSASNRKLLSELADYVMFLLERRRMTMVRDREIERERNARKLESLGALTRGIAHDFNNLLVGVLGNASLATEHLPAEHPSLEPIRYIGDAARQAKNLTMQLMAYGGEQPRSIDYFDVGDALGNLTALMQSTLPGNLQVCLEIESGLPLMAGDQTQITQVAMNLISNAAESYSDGGVVNVTLSKKWISSANSREFGLHESGPYVLLEVSDRGCGMDPESCKRLFDPYFSTKISGRGLGMSIVQRIVEDHAGSISVSSSTGQGTSVSVLLPTGNSEHHRLQRHSQRADAISKSAGMVLVVDDEEMVIRTTCLAIDSLGYASVAANNGRKAIEILDSDAELDVLILDATMPEISSQSIVDKILKRRPRLRTVITTGHQIEEIAPKFAGIENLAFLPKPWTVEELAGSIGDVSHRKVRH